MRSRHQEFNGLLLFRKIQSFLKSGIKPAFFFDFDGTLTEIVLRPEDVYLKPITREVLDELAGKFTVCVISGRQIDDVKRYVRLKGIYYSGNHGVEIEGPGIKFVEKESARLAPYLASLARELRRRLAKYGVRVNSKGYSISVHYRSIEPEKVEVMLEQVDDILAQPSGAGKIKVFHGKKVVEVKTPVDWDKGKAIELIVRKVGATVKPVFFGDDTTDEYGFRKVNSVGGLSVYVGGPTGRTAAIYRVDSPADLVGELTKFLLLLG